MSRIWVIREGGWASWRAKSDEIGTVDTGWRVRRGGIWFECSDQPGQIHEFWDTGVMLLFVRVVSASVASSVQNIEASKFWEL